MPDKKMTLLETAKKLSQNRKRYPSSPVTDDELELLMAVLRGEVTTGEAACARGLEVNGSTAGIATLLWRAIRAGQISVSVNGSSR